MSKEDSPATWSRLAASMLTDCEGSAILQRAVPGGRLTAGCPSGQRERSVKPSAQPTLVRTQHLPLRETPRSLAYARLCDWDADGVMRCHGLFVIVGAFALVRSLDTQAGYGSWPMSRRMGGEVSGRVYPTPNHQIAKPQVRSEARCQSLLRMERSKRPSAA